VCSTGADGDEQAVSSRCLMEKNSASPTSAGAKLQIGDLEIWLFEDEEAEVFAAARKNVMLDVNEA
jgi:hypothetical protein